MAAAEAAQTSLGPSFAPEDPSLPKPWKGLIDGSTGVLYYWNPETNVTQYEKPAGSAPPVPSGPPLASTLQLAPVLTSNSTPSNGPISQQQTEQQTFQQPFEHVQQLQQNQLQPSVQQMPLQQLHQQPYQQLQLVQGQPPMQISQQPSQQYSHLQQLPFHQAPYIQGQLISRPQGQFQYQPGPQAFQFPYQQGQQPKSRQPLVGQELHESQASHQLGQQLQGSQHSEQQVQRLQAPNATHEPGQKSQSPTAVQQYGMQPHVQNFLKQQDMLQQGPQPSQQQLPQIGFPRVGDSAHQEGRMAGSSSLLQQAANHLLPGLTSQAHTSQSGVNIIQAQQQSPVKPSSGMDQAHQVALESSHHQVQTGSPLFSNQMSHSMVRPSVVSKAGYAEDQHERRGAEFYSSGRSEGPMIIPVQPKLAPLPLSRNQQDMRVGASGLPPSFPPKFTSSGHPGGLPSHGPPNMYGNAAFPHATSVRPHPRMFGAPDSPNISADAYRRHHEVTAMGDNIPAPFMTFEATGFPPEIMREIHAAGFLSPTPIQAQTWPVALQNRDVVAIAKTGSGKTLGYLIPAFIHLRRCQNNPQYGPTVLILAPTRELATQIQDEAIKFGRSSRISCTCLYGGAPKGPQLKEIDRGVDIVVATPGRLNDILEMGRINFRQVSFLVLDEADRMLDMGFELQIRKIVNVIPPRRQTLMYTATWPMEVRKIAGDLLVNPVQVNIGRVDELVANKSITQYVEVVSQMDKQRRLEQILRSQERGTKTIIFCSTKKLCDQLARSISRPFGAIAIHGDKSQTERDHVLNQFRTGRFPILVATDVAARGLDIKDIRVVVNYDFPTGTEDYVHRIGRTGRAGATGVSYTFFTEQDWKHAPELIKVLEGANQRVPQEIREMAARAGPPSQRPLPHGGMSRWDSGGGNSEGRMDFSGGRGTREFGRGGRGFGGRGGRSDFVDGRGGGGYRGRGFGRAGWGRHDRGGGLRDRFQNPDGRGRHDDRRGFGDRFRGRSYSRSPEKGRSRGYDRSRSDSRSWSRSRSRSRSWSRGRSPSRSRSRSRSYGRYEHPRSRSRSPRRRRVSGFDVPLVPIAGVGHHESELGRPSGLEAPPPLNPAKEEPAESDTPAPRIPGFDAPPAARMSPPSPGNGDVAFPGGVVGD